MSAYTSAVLALSPLGYWPLSETSSTYNDLVGGGAGNFSAAGTGSRGATSLLPGDSGNGCLDKTGTGRYGSIADNAVISPTGSVTAMGWCQPTAVTTAQHLFYKLASYGLSLRGSAVYWELGGPGNVNTLADTVVAGNPMFIAGTYDGATSSLYVNGVLLTSSAKSGAVTDNGNLLELGAVSNAQGFVGKLQHLALFGSALTAAQIQGLYTLGAASSSDSGGVNVYPYATTSISANASRLKITLINDSDTVIYVSLGGTASVGNGVRVEPNGGRWSSTIWKGAVSAIHGSWIGAKRLLVVEE